jgi:hypothetical protein
MEILIGIVAVTGLLISAYLLSKPYLLKTRGETQRKQQSNKSSIARFYQLDKKQIEEAYNTIDNSPYSVEKTTSTKKGNAGIKLPSGMEAGFEGSNVIERKANAKTTIEKLDIYVEYLILQNNITLDLENLLIHENGLKKFDDLLEDLKNYSHLSIDAKQIETQRKEIINRTARQIFDENLKKSRFNCLINDCDFKIVKGTSERIAFELILIHPMSKFLKKEILIRVSPLATTLKENGLAHFERNLNKSTTFTVFGTAKKVFEEDETHFEIQIDPLSIS